MSTLTQQLYSQSHWLADGSQTVWNFSFSGGYISREHVKAYTRGPLEDDPRVDLVLTPESFIGDFQIIIEPAVTVDHTLIIYRDTPKDLPLVDFADGANINEVSLDTVARQAVFVAAESADFLGVTTTADLAELAATAIANAGAAAASAANSLASANTAGTQAGNAAVSANASAASAVAASNSAAAAGASVTSAINTVLANMASTASSSTGTGMLGWLRAGTSAIATTLYRWLGWQSPSIFEFMTLAQIADYQAGTGSIDLTAAITAAEAARSPGESLIFPRGTGYATGSVVATKPGTWDFRGKLKKAGDGIYCTADDFTFEGNGVGEVEYTTSGTPGENRAIRALGSLSATHSISAPLAVGAMSFTDGSAAAGTLAARDWVAVIDNDVTNDILFEMHQVLSVAGSTVNLTTPVLQAFNTFTQQWIKVTPRKNVWVNRLKITSTSTGTACIGIDFNGGTVDCGITNCILDVKNGLPWNVYFGHNATIDHNVVKQQVGQKAAVSEIHGGSVSFNKFWSEDAVAGNGALLFETGVCFMDVIGNQAFGGTGGTGIFTFNYVTKCRVANNFAAGDGTTIGYDLTGARDNIFANNHGVNLAQGMRIASDTATTPDYTSIKNVVTGLHLRSCTTGVNIGAACTANTVDFEADSTVTTPYADAGSGNIITYRDQTDNTLKIVPRLKLDAALINKRVDAGWSGTLAINAALGNEFDINGVDSNVQTVPAPTNSKEGQVIVLTIRNVSGGALGAFTWNAIFKMAGSTMTLPGDNNSRSIMFRYNGTNWVEWFRSAADIPN